MSMCKDRLRVVGWSKHRPSPPPAYMDTNARGAAYHIHTIYIRRYGHRPTTLILWILDLHRLTGAKSHQPPNPQTHRIHRPASARVTWITGHRKPLNYWLTEKPPHTHMCWINLAYLRLAIWLAIGCLSHHPSRCSIHGSQACHLPPIHLSHQPIGLPATMCILAHH